MSSLLQFNGKITKAGVHLLFSRGWTEPKPGKPIGEPKETFHCVHCNKPHEKLYSAARKPKGMFGCWVVFRYCGKDRAPDLSVPISCDPLPKDAKPLDEVETCKYWRS